MTRQQMAELISQSKTKISVCDVADLAVNVCKHYEQTETAKRVIEKAGKKKYDCLIEGVLTSFLASLLGSTDNAQIADLASLEGSMVVAVGIKQRKEKGKNNGKDK